MHKQVSGWTVNFGPNFPESPCLELKTRKPPPPPHFGKLQIWDDQSLLRNTPPPHFGKLQIWNDQSLLQNTPPHFGKLQIWDDQSLLQNTPPHFRKLQIWDDQSLLRNTPPFQKTSDLGWPKFTPEYPPPHFRFGMTKVYSRIPPPHFGKLQIWDDQSLLRNTPPHFRKTSNFTPEYPPISENFRFGMTKVYSGIPPPNENCQRV